MTRHDTDVWTWIEEIKRAIAKSVAAATDGAGTLSFEPIEGLRDGEKVDAYVDLGHELIFHEELATAEAAIDRALRLAPRELYVLDAKAEVCVEAGRYEDALAVYQTMYELAPHEPAVVVGLAQLMLSTDAADAAVAVLEKHASWNFPETQQCLGEALFAAGHSAKALASAEPELRDGFRFTPRMRRGSASCVVPVCGA